MAGLKEIEGMSQWTNEAQFKHKALAFPQEPSPQNEYFT